MRIAALFLVLVACQAATFLQEPEVFIEETEQSFAFAPIFA